MFLEPVCFFFEMGVRGKMITCGNKFLLTISNKKEIVYELEFTMIIEDGPRQGCTDLSKCDHSSRSVNHVRGTPYKTP